MKPGDRVTNDKGWPNLLRQLEGAGEFSREPPERQGDLQALDPAAQSRANLAGRGYVSCKRAFRG